jgi:hypothetical protein
VVVLFHQFKDLILLRHKTDARIRSDNPKEYIIPGGVVASRYLDLNTYSASFQPRTEYRKDADHPSQKIQKLSPVGVDVDPKQKVNFAVSRIEYSVYALPANQSESRQSPPTKHNTDYYTRMAAEKNFLAGNGGTRN